MYWFYPQFFFSEQVGAQMVWCGQLFYCMQCFQWNKYSARKAIQHSNNKKQFQFKEKNRVFLNTVFQLLQFIIIESIHVKHIGFKAQTSKFDVMVSCQLTFSDCSRQAAGNSFISSSIHHIVDFFCLYEGKKRNNKRNQI